MKFKHVLVTFIIVLIGILVVYIYNSGKSIATYHSPDNKYQLVVKNQLSIFDATMPGDGGSSRSVEVVLLDAYDKVIGTSNSNDDCGVLLFSIDVFWDLENNQVWYTRAKTINLKTGKVEC